MAEINFRFEFQALDCRARTGTPYEDQPESEIMLMRCFPDQSFAVPSFSAANHGIASLSPRERAHYLFALARVMARWKSVNPNGLIVQTGQQQWSIEKINELESEIVTIYTQLFYDSFR